MNYINQKVIIQGQCGSMDEMTIPIYLWQANIQTRAAQLSQKSQYWLFWVMIIWTF